MSELHEKSQLTLISILNSSQPVELRIAAARGLGHIGGNKAISTLMSVLGSDESIDLRVAVAEALGLAAKKS